MDSNVDNSQTEYKQTPNWNCLLDSNGKKKVTVGDVSYLKCTGLDAVKVLPKDSDLNYSLEFDKDDGLFPYAVYMLSTTKDEPNEKIFRVTSYYASKGELSFRLKLGEETLFQSGAVSLNVETVLKSKQQKPFPPQGPSLILASTPVLIASFILILIFFGYSLFRLFKRVKLRSEYKRVLLRSDYPDPYMDFNIDLRNLAKKKKKANIIFAEDCELAFKKLFFRIFKKPVSFESGSRLAFELRRRGVPDHKIRNMFVLQKDYRAILSQNLKEDEIQDFLIQARRVAADLKKFLPPVDGAVYV